MLAARLLGRLGDRGALLTDRDALEVALVTLVGRGEQRLPHRPLDREAFVDAIGEALANWSEDVDLAAVSRVAAEDLYLAAAIVARDDRAIAIAEDELVSVARRAAARVDRQPSFVDEVAQRVRERFVGHGIASYRATGPLARWIRVVAARIAIDLKRESGRLRHIDVVVPAPDDPELAMILRTSAEAYAHALERAFDTLERSERILLRQRYIDELELDALGRLHKVHPSTVLRRLQRIEARLAELTRATLAEQLDLTDSQVESIERLVASQLPISVTRLLRRR